MAWHAPALAGGMDWTDVQAAPRQRRRIAMALLLALAVHLLALLLAAPLPWREATQPRPPLAIVLDTRPVAVLPAAERMRVVPERPTPMSAPAPAVELPAPPRPAAVPRTTVAPSRAAVRAPVPATSPPVASDAPLPRQVPLFDADGRPRLPAGALDAPPDTPPSWVDAPRQAAPWELRPDPLVYEPTAFEPYWKPVDESLLGEFIRHNTHSKTFKLPDGTRVTCSWVLIIGGCGW